MKTSLITPEQMRKHLDEAREIVDVVRATFEQRGFHLLSVGIAGARLIVTACEALHGDLDWWCRFMRTGVDDFIVRVDGAPNIQRGGST